MDNQKQQDMSAGYLRSHYRNAGLYLPEELFVRLDQEASDASEVDDALPNELNVDLTPANDAVVEAISMDIEPESLSPTIPVFDLELVKNALLKQQRDNSDRAQLAMMVLEDMAVNEGQRRLIEQPPAEIFSRFARLETEMPNFAPIITLLTAELALACASRPEDFRVTCICLNGVPGIGKTRFAKEVGKILGVGFEHFSMGSAQGCFELTGTSSSWTNTRPGRLVSFMAKSSSACPLILLDEIDKIDGDGRFPIVPALLDLLERDTAKQFRDDCLEFRFDASKIIFLATSNERSLIPPPLLSRMRVVDVLIPTSAQRRAIIERMAGEYAELGVSFQADVLDTVCDFDMDLRQMTQLVRGMAGQVLAKGEKVVTMPPEYLPKEGARMGFV